MVSAFITSRTLPTETLQSSALWISHRMAMWNGNVQRLVHWFRPLHRSGWNVRSYNYLIFLNFALFLFYHAPPSSPQIKNLSKKSKHFLHWNVWNKSKNREESGANSSAPYVAFWFIWRYQCLPRGWQLQEDVPTFCRQSSLHERQKCQEIASNNSFRRW